MKLCSDPETSDPDLKSKDPRIPDPDPDPRMNLTRIRIIKCSLGGSGLSVGSRITSDLKIRSPHSDLSDIGSYDPCITAKNPLSYPHTQPYFFFSNECASHSGKVQIRPSTPGRALMYSHSSKVFLVSFFVNTVYNINPI